jgi:hypothetical protein
MRIERVLIPLVGLAVLIGAAVAIFRGAGPLPDPEGCHATVDGYRVDINTEQAQNASIIAAVAVRRGLPARAVSIALATAFQESKLYNLDYGDRDSLGLFQQRTSQGWGTRNQILDPWHSSGTFYDALERITGYEHLRITVAAQRVQRSGYPEAYAEHAPDARALASALTGYSPHRFSCVVHTPVHGSPGAVVAALHDGLAVSSSRSGGTVTVPVSSRRNGWVVASYLAANANRLGLAGIGYAGRSWSAGRASENGWVAVQTAKADRVVTHVG